MFAGLTGVHLIVILAVILLLFGAAKLPGLAKSMGQSARVFKDEMNTMKQEDAARADKESAEDGVVGNSASEVKKPSSDSDNTN
ncbi:twin-arginine translocase TatA/TatE family subunit [Microbacterium sp. YY-01]|uniref:twin-arginine translocase TatA/TatE family subunit n=1 Tax=Microbacterium sp. YY-01 TaxID=3421634 RepID=UPI003D172AF5